jgi:hypothetical protein
MTTTREAGQTQASADALGAYLEAVGKASDARIEVRRLQRQLSEARKVLKSAEAVEKAADARYIATPYSANREECSQ